MSPDWQRLFPATDHRFQMGLRLGDARSFWSTQDATGKVYSERQSWLDLDSAHYRAEIPDGAPALAEARTWIRQWTATCEPDWIVLSDGLRDEPRVLGGEVVFPSSWSLPEKVGLPLSAVHGPVPGLEASLGKAIQTFLSRIQPEAAWERDNWGLSADAELNHHPSRNLPGLDASARLHTTWLRLERQFLTRLPLSKALLFGIRVSHHRLDELAADPEVAAGLTRALETMEKNIAHYKGLQHAREPLLRELRSHLD
ncbi:heme-dependent oxidative N-demethylase subunit alpha family protein [Prosthecobacter sp. SYSU 5D2]